MRGYGQTDAPPNIQDYTQFQFVGDVVGLVHTLGYEQAVIAGHDLGAQVAHNAAILRPDMFRAVILLSVPYGVRTESAVKPTEAMRRRAPAEQKALDGCVDPKQLPAWLKPEDLDYYAEEYSRTEFRGGLNWYRGQDIFWQETPFLIGRKLPQPTLYVGGIDDPVVEFARH
jgi:pimeloyl-ACP methyl ester carboxylesterase